MSWSKPGLSSRESVRMSARALGGVARRASGEVPGGDPGAAGGDLGPGLAGAGAMVGGVLLIGTLELALLGVGGYYLVRAIAKRA